MFTLYCVILDMPRSKKILSGDEYISKTEKMIGLPKKYPNLSKAEKMVYLPRFYYNDYEKIDDGFLDYIPLNYQTTLVELILRPDTAFGYPTWKSVFGSYDNINQSPNSFIFNSDFSNTIDCYSDWNFQTSTGPFIDTFFPYAGGFYSVLEGYTTWFQDDDRFVNCFISSPVVRYIVLNFNQPLHDRRIQLLNNNRAKIVFAVTPV